MKRLILLLFWICMGHTLVFAQFFGQNPPPNDMCAKAVELVAGDRLAGYSNADATPSLEYEMPATVETTCIQTIENDLWFKFKAVAGVEAYEIQITTGFCSGHLLF